MSSLKSLNKNIKPIIQKILIDREISKRECRQSFWRFCQLLHNYQSNWNHLIELTNILQQFYERKLINEKTGKPYKKLMINLPPRHYKSRTLVLFCCWILGINPDEKIITCSYSDDLATDFSKYTRNEISLQKNFDYEIVYNDIFPKTKLKYGDASFHKWALEGKHFTYKGAGFGGSITGKGCTIGIIDDQIKDYEEACNDLRLEKNWNWYTGTYLSRLEKNALQIICMTRWTDKDICGMLLENEKEANEWYIHKREVYNEDQGMLCDDILDIEGYENKKRMMLLSTPEQFHANYHNTMITKKGALYQNFATYTDFPRRPKDKILLYDRLIGYIDYADEGDNYLCCLLGLEYFKKFYVTEVIYTKDQSEKTEDLLADAIIRNKTINIKIESQAGGKAFAKNVRRKIVEKGVNNVNIEWFHQSKNKLSRIISNSTNVENRIHYPVDWALRWPEYYKAMTTFLNSRKNKYDDAQDATTGIVEMMDEAMKPVFIKNFR
jgi:predicted phage terminase large subunit-like protein